ncbi:hypothetical protein [Streptomyces sp. NPDC049879]|uniref:DUF7544 domain-containing protein n=1 Tax=Streptomyces sp. NPDC049879 TaxID=3365598 RepID=UPI0037A89640
MSDSPGWAPPGSPPPEDGPQGHSPADPAAPPSPAPAGQQPPPVPPPPPQQQPQGWGQQPQGWGQQPQQPQGWGQQPQGWGSQQPQGWGQPQWASPGWHPAAHAAKPGVIPLRPLGVGEILDGAVTTARTHWRTVLTVAFAIAVLTQLVSALGMALWVDDTSMSLLSSDETTYTDEELNDALRDFLVWGGTTTVVSLLGTVLTTAMLTMVVSRAVLGRSVTVGEAWHDSRPRLLRLLGLVLLVPLIAVGAVVVPIVIGALSGSDALLALLAIAAVATVVWLWVQFSLAAPALMLERQGVMPALRRSWKLVTGSWWRIFGIQLLMMVILAVVAGIIEYPVSLVAALISGQDTGAALDGTADLTWSYLLVSGIGAVVSATITLPISAGVTALLYIDQRIRREALDIELARAAGVAPAPGT